MRILGIDPGLRITGFGCVDLADGAEPALVEAGVLRLDADETVPDRLLVLFNDLTEVIERLKPEVMVVEKLYSHYAHPTTAIKMGHARGVILLAARAQGVETDEIAATEVKKSISGNGHAGKRQIQEAVRAQCGLDEIPKPPDVADAIAIALCAARRRAAATA